MTLYDIIITSHDIIISQTSILQDPLISQQVDYSKEEKVIRDCDHGVSPDPKTTPLGRDDTDPVMWLAMKLVQINSDTRNRSRYKYLHV